MLKIRQILFLVNGYFQSEPRKTDTNNSKNESIISKKFLDIVDSIGYSPTMQYPPLKTVSDTMMPLMYLVYMVYPVFGVRLQLVYLRHHS